MPEIAAAPNPVVAGLNANSSNAAANAGSMPDAAAADNGGAGADPFSAMLQRLIKSQGSGGDAAELDSAKLALMMESQSDKAVAAGDSTNAEEAIANLMLMLQSRMEGQPVVQGPQSAAAARQDEKIRPIEDKDENTIVSDTSVTETTPAVSTLAAPVVAVSNEARGDSEQDNAANNGKTGPSVAAEAAILARSDNAAAAKEPKEGEETFQNLLDTARDIRHAAQANNTPVVTQAARQEHRIETPVGHQNWSQEVGDKLTWMVGKQESKVELVLNPPQMGRIEVSITLNGDQASATFGSANPAVREALESALPRLREVLADAGVRLDQAQVGSDSRGDSPQNQERRDNSGHNNKVASGEFVPGLLPASSSAGPWTQKGNGMVDTFA